MSFSSVTGHTWIGSHDPDDDENFVWLNGNPLPDNDENWFPGKYFVWYLQPKVKVAIIFVF